MQVKWAKIDPRNENKQSLKEIFLSYMYNIIYKA